MKYNSDSSCIVPPQPGLARQPGPIAYGTPPPFIRAWAPMLRDANPLQQIESGLGEAQRYVDVSNLNTREDEMWLSGLGSVGSGSLGGNVLGAELGATPPTNVCKYFQYECQNWNQYPPSVQSQITAAANQMAEAQKAQTAELNNAVQLIAQEVESSAGQAQDLAAQSVGVAEAAVLAAEKCDIATMNNLIAQSDTLHAQAAGKVQETGDAASDLYKLAGTYPQNAMIVNAAQTAGGIVSSVDEGVKNADDARQAAISAAKKRAALCGGAPKPLPEPEEPPEPTPQKASRAGLLWLGLASVAAMGLYAATRKKKGGQP